MVDGIEQTNDLPLHFEGVRDGDFLFQQIGDGRRDDGLAISRRTVDEHRVAGVDGWPEAIQDVIGEHQMIERVVDGVARCRSRHQRAVGIHVALILDERHGCHAHVVTAFEEKRGAGTPGVGDAIAIRRPANDTAADNLALMLCLEQIQCRFDDRKRQPQPATYLGPSELSGKMQRLENELDHEVESNPGFLHRLRRSRVRDDFGCGKTCHHGYCPNAPSRRSVGLAGKVRSISRSWRARSRARLNVGRFRLAASNAARALR